MCKMPEGEEFEALGALLIPAGFCLVDKNDGFGKKLFFLVYDGSLNHRCYSRQRKPFYFYFTPILAEIDVKDIFYVLPCSYSQKGCCFIIHLSHVVCLLTCQWKFL